MPGIAPSSLRIDVLAARVAQAAPAEVAVAAHEVGPPGLAPPPHADRKGAGALPRAGVGAAFLVGHAAGPRGAAAAFAKAPSIAAGAAIADAAVVDAATAVAAGASGAAKLSRPATRFAGLRPVGVEAAHEPGGRAQFLELRRVAAGLPRSAAKVLADDALGVEADFFAVEGAGVAVGDAAIVDAAAPVPAGLVFAARLPWASAGDDFGVKANIVAHGRSGALAHAFDATGAVCAGGSIAAGLAVVATEGAFAAGAAAAIVGTGLIVSDAEARAFVAAAFVATVSWAAGLTGHAAGGAAPIETCQVRRVAGVPGAAGFPPVAAGDALAAVAGEVVAIAGVSGAAGFAEAAAVDAAVAPASDVAVRAIAVAAGLVEAAAVPAGAVVARAALPRAFSAGRGASVPEAAAAIVAIAVAAGLVGAAAGDAVVSKVAGRPIAADVVGTAGLEGIAAGNAHAVPAGELAMALVPKAADLIEVAAVRIDGRVRRT